MMPGGGGGGGGRRAGSTGQQPDVNINSKVLWQFPTADKKNIDWIQILNDYVRSLPAAVSNDDDMLLLSKSCLLNLENTILLTAS